MQYQITGAQQETLEDDNALESPPVKQVLSFREKKRSWDVPVKLFESEETAMLMKLYKPLALLEKSAWTLKAGGKHEISGAGITALASTVIKLGKSLMTI